MATTQPAPRTGSSTNFVRNARGGISVGAVLTGVVVAFGAMTLLSAVVAGVVSMGLAEDTPFPGSEVQGTVFAGVVLALTQFVGYLWGGYTAGRMARGAGLVNGLLVPLIAVLLLAVVGAIVAAFSATTSLHLPSRPLGCLWKGTWWSGGGRGSGSPRRSLCSSAAASAARWEPAGIRGWSRMPTARSPCRPGTHPPRPPRPRCRRG